MQTLSPDESRKVLDAMGIPVVVSRDRISVEPSPAAAVTESMPRREHKVVGCGKKRGQGVADVDVDTKFDSPAFNALVEVPTAAGENIPSGSGKTEPLQFSVVSAVTASTLLACELPVWAGGLLEGRLTGICTDLMRMLSPGYVGADWQYFHWPIAGFRDQSEEQANEALDAWLHRRWAETRAQEPLIVLSGSSIDLSSIFADALMLPTLDEMTVSADAKRAAWHAIQDYHCG